MVHRGQSCSSPAPTSISTTLAWQNTRFRNASKVHNSHMWTAQLPTSQQVKVVGPSISPAANGLHQSQLLRLLPTRSAHVPGRCISVTARGLPLPRPPCPHPANSHLQVSRQKPL